MSRTALARSSPARRKPRVQTKARAAEPVAPRPTLMDESPRGRILRAAAHLFLTRGFARTTVRDLASAVGILSGSIFHHFGSKEEILEAVMSEVSALNTERMKLAAASAAQPLARVRALIRCELDSIHGETSEAMTLLASEWRSLGGAAQARVLVLRDAYEDVWLAALGEARSELAVGDPFILRKLLQGMTAGSANWYRARGAISLDALTSQILTLIARKRARHA